MPNRSKLDWALDAARRGLCVFPLSPNSKIPLFGSDGFKSATLDETLIRAWWKDHPDANIGIHPGKEHVIVDLDTKKGKNGPEVLCERLGVELWELTGATFAVETPSGGIHLYYIADRPYGDAVDVLKGVDIRASGGYVAGPGSVIDGVPYSVVNDMLLLPVRDDMKPILNLPRERQQNAGKPLFELDQEFARTRALDFLRKRSPAIEGIGGNLHTFTTAALVKDLGISESTCLQLMLTPIHADGKSWNDCCHPPWDGPELKVVVANAFKYGKDRPGSKGGGAMEAFDSSIEIEDGESDLPPDDANDTPAVDIPIADVIERINRRFAVVMGGGNNAGGIVDLEKPSSPSFVKPESFHRIYANRTVPIKDGEGKIKFVPASKIWLASNDRREISTIVFEPTGSKFLVPARAHNIWQGFAVEPKEGSSHEPLLNHIRDNICQGDGERIDFLLAWLADMVQRPGDKPGVAVALRGEFGAGKSALYEFLRIIFGPHAMKVSQPEHFTGRFNFHLARLILLGAEESFFAGDKRSESVIKDQITASEMTVEQKFADPMTLHSHTHFLVTSNAEWVVPAAAGDRRWAVLDVAADKKDDRAYWEPIFDAKNGDGPAHLLRFLLDHEYDRKILHRPPMTMAKAEQAIQSLPPVERWFLEVLRGERDPYPHADAEDSIFDAYTPKERMTADYVVFCQERRLRIEDARQFWKAIRAILSDKVVQKQPGRRDSGRQRVIWMPERTECRAAFAAHLKCGWSDLETIEDL